MTQHEILMLVSAPLLVLGKPSASVSLGIVAIMARTCGESLRVQMFSRKAGQWSALRSRHGCLSALALWVWHAPWLFDQTLQSDWIHAAQHTSFLDRASVLVAAREPNAGFRLRCRDGLRLYDNSAHQCLGSIAHIFAASLVLALCHNCSGLGHVRSRRSTTRWADHVDSRGNPFTHRCFGLAGEVDE